MTYRLTLIAAIALLSLLPATSATAREIRRARARIGRRILERLGAFG